MKLLITGVGQRIGRYLAMQLREQGYDILGTYRTERNNLLELRDVGIDLFQCDFASHDSLVALITYIQSSTTELRGVIHNASNWSKDLCADSSKNVIHNMMQVHAYAPYELNLALQPQLLACSSGCADIIHISDYVATKGSKKHIAYAASKAAMENMTLSFAQLFAPQVKVNSIAPALILFNEQDSEEYKVKAAAKSLMNKEAGVDEMLLAVNYLLNSQYVTGQRIAVDGGRHLA